MEEQEAKIKKKKKKKRKERIGCTGKYVINITVILHGDLFGKYEYEKPKMEKPRFQMIFLLKKF